MHYNPSNPIDPEEWFALDEDERRHAVQVWMSEQTGTEAEDCVTEAISFMAVENQIADDNPPVTRATLERLTAAGIDRAMAVAMMAEAMFDEMHAIIEDEREFDAEAYTRALEQLDPEEIKALGEADLDEPRSYSAIPEFSPEDRQVLIDFGQRHADEGAMSYPETAGFLFAVTACPELIMPSEWTEIVQGDAVFADAEEAGMVMQARMALMNWISTCIQQTQPAIPDECRPGPEPLAILEADNDFSRWCRGFSTGHHWLAKVWEEEIDEDSEDDFALGSALVVLSFFGDRPTAEMLIKDSGPEGGSVEEAAEVFHPMIEAAIHDYAALGLEFRRTSQPRHPVRSQKIGRNQPCPCGSGKKYKKCCGGPGTVH